MFKLLRKFLSRTIPVKSIFVDAYFFKVEFRRHRVKDFFVATTKDKDDEGNDRYTYYRYPVRKEYFTDKETLVRNYYRSTKIPISYLCTMDEIFNEYGEVIVDVVHEKQWKMARFLRFVFRVKPNYELPEYSKKEILV